MTCKDILGFKAKSYISYLRYKANRMKYIDWVNLPTDFVLQGSRSSCLHFHFHLQTWVNALSGHQPFEGVCNSSCLCLFTCRKCLRHSIDAIIGVAKLLSIFITITKTSDSLSYKFWSEFWGILDYSRNFWPSDWTTFRHSNFLHSN